MDRDRRGAPHQLEELPRRIRTVPPLRYLEAAPVRQLEGLPEGLGIVADDAMAGGYAALVLFLAGWFNLY
jgi:hypothetical protein